MYRDCHGPILFLVYPCKQNFILSSSLWSSFVYLKTGYLSSSLLVISFTTKEIYNIPCKYFDFFLKI